MSSDPKSRAPLRFDTLADFLGQKLDREPAVLDLLLTAEQKGQGKPELWPLLHEAAQRDGRLSELGAAYERVAKDKKIKTLPPAGQAEILVNGGLFFADVNPDAGKAIDFFEKAIAALPGHPLAFERLEKLLMDNDELGKLCDLYLAAAPTRSEKSQQLEMLRAGVDLSAGVGDDERTLKLYQQILKIEPGDVNARKELEESFMRLGRFADTAALLEQALGSSPSPADSEAVSIRGRALKLYVNELKQPDKALAHLEEILRINPADDGALVVAQQMLGNKNLAARAASLLADALDRAGNAEGASKMLAIEIENLRGPKRIEAQKKLANLIFKKMGDIHGAFAHVEAIVSADPGDEEFRQRYREIAVALDKRADVAKTLTRSLVAAKEPALKAKINVELGELYVELGDVKKARMTFQGVLDAGGDEGATLRAARAMAKLSEGSGDQKTLIAMLEKLVDLEDSPDSKAEVGLRLAKMYEQDLSDEKSAARVYRKLFDTPAEPDALIALERLSEAAGNFKDLADVLERRSILEGDSDEGRELAFRAADIRTSKLNDRAAALESWRVYIATHGPSREVHARMFPLLEQEKKWEELAQRLTREADLAPEAERPAVLSRIGQIRFGKLGDERGGLEAFREALAMDRSERTSRSVMEKALSSGSHRAFAASVLDPIARQEGAAELLVRVLETKGSLAADVNDQLSAFAEAAALCEKELSNAKRALEISGRGLLIAIEELAVPEPPAGMEIQANLWLGRALSYGAQNAAGRAEVLSKALGDRDISTPWLSELAEHTGEALAESGQGAQALAVFRKALAFSPSSPKLLARVDELLQEQGSPEERAAMYQTALQTAEEPAAKRKLLHKIGMLELSELGNPAAAAETFRKILSEEPSDRKAYEALLAAHDKMGPSEAYYADLEQGLQTAEGKEREALRLKLAQIALALGNKEHALDQYRGLLADHAVFSPQDFDTLEKLAIEQNDVQLLCSVLNKRVEGSEEPAEQAKWLERLGDLAQERQGDKQAAAEYWKRAGAAAEKAAASASDLGYAQRLYERALAINTTDQKAAEQLVALYQRGELWEKLPPIYEMLLRSARDAQEAVRRLLAFEEAAIRAKVPQRFVDAAATVERLYGPLPNALSAAVQLSLARVLAAEPDRQDEAAAIYRKLLESPESDLKSIYTAFEGFLEGKTRHEDRRYLYAFRLARATEDERIPLLLAWAQDEERTMSDAKAASELYARVLAINPDHAEALEARARLLLDAGDVEGAVLLIATQRNARTGESRAALDRHLATLYIERLDRPWLALSTIEPVLEENPGDEEAIAIAARTLDHPDTRARAASVLEQVCDRAESQEIRTKILDTLLSTPSDAPELRAKRTGWFERLLAPLSDNPHKALEVTLRAVAERPNEAALWDRVEQLGRETSLPEMVAEAYRREIQRQKEGQQLDMDAIEELGRRAVEYHEQWKDDPTEIAALLAQIVELIPESTWAFERLKMAYNASEQWEALFSLYDRALERVLDRSDRMMLLEEAVEAARNLAIDTERTMGYLEQLLPLKKDARTRSSLERLYEKHGKFRPLIDLLSGQLGELDTEAAQRMRCRIAGLWLDGLQNAASAFEVIAQILKLEPTRSEGIALLEKLLELTARMKEANTASAEALGARSKAAGLLEHRYRSDGKSADLVRVLSVSLESLTDVGERAARLREITEVRRDTLGDLPGALEAAAALFVIEPGTAANRAELERLAAELKRYDSLALALREASAGLQNRAQSRQLLIDAAAIYRDHLQDLAQAIELHTPIIELAEGDNGALLSALQELNRLLKAMEKAAERCTVLERLATVETSPEAKKQVLGEAARIAWTDLGDADRAIANYRARFRDDALDLEALDGIVTAQEQTGRFRDLVETLGLRAGAKIELGRTAEGRADFVSAARILDEQVGDADAAIDAWTALRGRLGPDAESGDALAALLSRRQKWDELVALLEHEIELSGAGERHAALLCRLGNVHRDYTMAWEQAVESYARGGRAGGEECLSGLEILLLRIDREAADQRPLLAQAVDALTEAYRSRNDWKRLVALLEVRLIAAENDTARVEILRESARLLELEGLDLSGAFDAIWRAFLLIPSAELASEALRLARAAGRFQEVADALTTSLDGRADVPVPVLCELWWNVALWHRDSRRDPDAAERAVIRALSYDPDSVEMLTALAELQRRNRNRSLVDTLLRLAEVVPDPLALYREAVETAFDPIADPVLTRQIAEQLHTVALTRAESEGPESPSLSSALWALDVLVRLSREDGDRARVMDLCLKGAEIPFPAAERKRLRMTAAEVAETESAIAIYKSLFDEEPTDGRVASELETLYRTTGRISELISMRKRQVEVAENIDFRVSLRFDLALLFAREGEREQALDALRHNLREAALHVPSVEKLCELLEQKGSFQELVDLLEGQAELREGLGQGGAEAGMAPADLWGRAAALAEQKLGDVPRAIADHRRAAAFDATSSLDALARLLTARGEHAQAAEVLDRLCVLTPAESAHVEYLRLAEALVAAGDAQSARTRLEHAAAIVKNPTPVRDRLAILYREAEAWGPLADLIASEAVRIESRTARAAKLREAAELHLEKRGDAASAAPLLEQAAELLPDDMPVRLTLVQAYVQSSRLDDATAILRGLLASYGGRRPKERAIVHYELARVLIAAGTQEEALEELEAALRIDPAHPDILYASARLALDMNQLDRASRAYRALLLNVRRARDDQSNRLMRTEILFALSEIAERQGEPERAAEYFDSAFEASRESAEERERLVGALRTRGRHGMLARALEARLAGAGDASQAVAILDELAQVYEDHLGRPDDALATRLRAISLDPIHDLAHRSARALADRTGHKSKYIELVSRLSDEAADDNRKLELLLHLGRAYGGDPAFDEQARSVYTRAEPLLAARPDEAKTLEVLRALDGIYGRRGEQEAQAAVLEKLIAAAPAGTPSEQADPMYRLAAIRLLHASGQERGCELLENAFALDPQADRVEQCLRDTIARIPSSEPALRVLEHLARTTQQPRMLLEAILLLHGIGKADSGQLREAVTIARDLGETALRESCLRALLSVMENAASTEDPSEFQIELGEIRESAGDFTEAAALFEQAAVHREQSDAHTLLLRVAAIARGPLGDLPRAARLYESLRKANPTARSAWEPLSDIYRQLGDEASLSELIEQTVPLLESQAEQSKLRVERAKIVMQKDPERAIELFNEILSADPAQLEASILLADILEKAGRDDELSEVLSRQLDGAKDRSDAAAAVSLSMKLGALLERKNDEERALALYKSALDWDEKHLPALRSIIRLAKQRNDAGELGNALAKLLSIGQNDEAAELSLYLSALRTEQGDLAGAEQALEAGFSARPDHADIRQKLIDSFTAREQWQKLADLHLGEASRKEDKTARIESLCHAAEVLRERAGDAPGAAHILEQALDLDAADRDVLFALTDAYDAMQAHERAVRSITLAMMATPEDPWLFSSRAVQRERLGLHDEALADLEQAYAMSGGSYAHELAEQLEKALAHASSEAQNDWEAPAGMNEIQRNIRLRLAEVLQKAGETDRARGHLSEVVTADPNDRDALRKLAALEQEANQPDAAATIYARLVHLEEGEALVSVATQLAAACEQAGRLHDAREGLERALTVAPDDPQIRERLRTIYASTGENAALSALLLEDAEKAAAPAAKLSLIVQAGRLLLDTEGGARKAMEALQKARAIKPDDQELLVVLADACTAAGENDEARNVIAQIIASYKGRRVKQLAPVYHRLARIESSEGKPQEALAALTKAFEMEPGSGVTAMALGLQAVELGEFEIAGRAFRSVTMMKTAPPGSTEGITGASKALAYFHLGSIARAQGDPRKARLMVEKAVNEDPTLESARTLLDELKAG